MPDQKQGPFTMSGCRGKRSLCMCVSLWVSLPLYLCPFPSLSECRRGQHTKGTQESLRSVSPARAGRGKGRTLRKAMVLKGKGRMETQRQRAPSPHRGSEPSPSPSPAAPSGFSDDTKAPLCPQVRRSTPLDLGMECRCRRMTSIP